MYSYKKTYIRYSPSLGQHGTTEDPVSVFAVTVQLKKACVISSYTAKPYIQSSSCLSYLPISQYECLSLSAKSCNCDCNRAAPVKPSGSTYSPASKM